MDESIEAETTTKIDGGISLRQGIVDGLLLHHVFASFCVRICFFFAEFVCRIHRMKPEESELNNHNNDIDNANYKQYN